MTLARALYLLGYRRNADQIARYLKKKGHLHTSHPRCTSCPVANYLNEALGLPPDALTGCHVGGSIAYAGMPSRFPNKGIDMPTQVMEFIDNFDRRQYQDLEND